MGPCVRRLELRDYRADRLCLCVSAVLLAQYIYSYVTVRIATALKFSCIEREIERTNAAKVSFIH